MTNYVLDIDFSIFIVLCHNHSVIQDKIEYMLHRTSIMYYPDLTLYKLNIKE
jgi:hypothetical protein